MKYKHLFFDLDHTLWDFEANSRATLHQLYVELDLAAEGVDDFDRFHRNYLLHNEKLWERYRNGYIKQEELRYKRMWLTLLDFKSANEALARELSIQFLELLPTRTILFPHATEILMYLLNRGYQLHLVTNGFDKTQHSKLQYAGINHYFTEVITSECSQCLKPHKGIFEYAFNRCAAKPEECIMIGDSIEADIQGGINAGIDQVHVNFNRVETEIKPTYTVYELKELEQIF